MIKNTLYIFFVLSLLSVFCLISCNYEPYGENYLEIDSVGVVPSVVVDLNIGWNSDTIYICKDETVTFSYRSNSDVVSWTMFTINGKETHAYTPDEYGSFQFSYYMPDLLPGIYPMSMTVCTHSGTGSLADVTGAEGYLLTKKWVLVITDQYSIRSQITSTLFVDGKLKIKWSSFKGIGFKTGKLYKEMPYIANSPVLVATITDQGQTEYIDNTYHGESSVYYLIINDTYWSNSVTVSGPLPELSVTSDPSGIFMLKWDIPPYSKNLKGYRVSYFDDMSGEYHLISEINDPTIDSCIIPNPILGNEYQFVLTMIPLTDCYYDEYNLHNFLSSKLTACYGTPSPVFYWSDQGSDPIIYMLNAGNIWAYNTEKGIIDATVYSNASLFRFSVSENNQYLISVLRDEKFLFFSDLKTPENSKKIVAKTSMPYSASISNKGTGIIITGTMAEVFDFIHDKKLGEINLSNDFLVINKISPSGNYFVEQTFAGYEFFMFKDSTIERLSCLTENAQDILFADYLSGTPERAVVATSNCVKLIDCDSWSVVSQWNQDNTINTVFNLDYPSRQLFFRTENYFMLLNVETGETKKMFPTTPNQNVFWWDLVYCDKQIFWSGGTKMSVAF